jgi:hypothetical protein
LLRLCRNLSRRALADRKKEQQTLSEIAATGEPYAKLRMRQRNRVRVVRRRAMCPSLRRGASVVLATLGCCRGSRR